MGAPGQDIGAWVDTRRAFKISPSKIAERIKRSRQHVHILELKRRARTPLATAYIAAVREEIKLCDS